MPMIAAIYAHTSRRREKLAELPEVRTAQIGALRGDGGRCPGFCGSTAPRIVTRCSEGSPHRLAWASTSAAASIIVSATATHPQEQDTAHRAAMAELK